MTPKTNNLQVLRMYESDLAKCIRGLESAIKCGTFGTYYKAEMSYAISSDKESKASILLDKDDLTNMLGKRMADLNELKDKIKWLEDLAQETADKMERDK